jgi:hypothetical protein
VKPEKSFDAGVLLSEAVKLRAANRRLADESSEQHGFFDYFTLQEESQMRSVTWRAALDDQSHLSSLEGLEVPVGAPVIASIRKLHGLMPPADSIKAKEVWAFFDVMLAAPFWQWSHIPIADQHGPLKLLKDYEFQAKHKPIDGRLIDDVIAVVRELAEPVKPANKPKRSTVGGEGRVKLIGAITKHHKYSNGSCLNWNYVGNNELARLAGVHNSTASDFFKKEFEGHSKYKTFCQNETNLVTALQMLNDEFTPAILYKLLPDEPADAESDDDGDE